MKTNKTILKRISLMLFISVVTALGFLISCEKENIQPVGPQDLKSSQKVPDELLPLPEICSEIIHKDLLLKDNTKIGDVYLLNDAHYFYVHVLARKGTLFHNAYLYAGLMENIPMTREMNPDVERFTRIIKQDDFGTVRRFKIPMKELSGKFIVSLMVQTKDDKLSIQEDFVKYFRAWADGKLYGNTNIGRLFTYKKGICRVDDPVAFNE